MSKLLASLPRFGTSASIAIGITFGLFLLMQVLIDIGRTPIDAVESFKIPDILMPPEQIETQQEFEQLERADEPPPPPDLATPDIPPNFDTIAVQAQAIKPQVEGVSTGGTLFRDGEYLPLFKVQPRYPRRALERGLEGWAIVEFTITTTGATRDPVVVESDPPGVFDAASRSAALKLKYKPRVVDGTAVEVHDVPHRFVFKLAAED